MSTMIQLKSEPREARGSGAARRLRRTGNVPAALNRLSGETLSLQLNAHDFGGMLSHLVSENVLVTLDVAGQPVLALLREVQHDVLSSQPIHADFGEIDPSRKMRATITILLGGEPDGVRNAGGVLTQLVRHVTVDCLPADFLETFTVDVSELKLGESLNVGALKLGEKYTLVTHADVVLAAVVAPAAEEVVAAPAEGVVAEGVAAGTPEVIAKGKKEEEAEGAAAAKGKKETEAAPAATAKKK